MKKPIKALLPDIDKEISIELDDSRSPKTFQTILENLPVEISITKWGDELYTDRTPIVANEENARRDVDYLDVATGLKVMHYAYFMDLLPSVKMRRYWLILL
jgi:hypothetical protein